MSNEQMPDDPLRKRILEWKVNTDSWALLPYPEEPSFVSWADVLAEPDDEE